MFDIVRELASKGNPGMRRCNRAIKILLYDIKYHILFGMSWKVTTTSKVQKRLVKLSPKIKDLFQQLALDIEALGPVRGDWPNYSKLADGSHHCHLNYSYVAVWRVVANQIKFVEVTYVGSREDAPY